jgi:phage host-nuclease inhibitor protein Gam
MRIKAISEIKSRAEFERVINDIVDKQIVKERLELRRDKKLLEVRKDFDEGINDLSDQIQTSVIRAEKFAAEHRDELLPSKKKSAETTFAFFGFRTGNPTLVLLNRKWTWRKVIDAIRAMDWLQYLVVKTSVDKDALKAQLNNEQLAAIGTRIEQKEVFFVDPKRDPADPQRLVSQSGIQEARSAA